MSCKQLLRWMATTMAVACWTLPAYGVSPGPTSRDGLLYDALPGICQASQDPTKPTLCIGNADCAANNEGPCSVVDSPIVVRALMTLIVDHDSAGWNDPASTGYVDVTNSFDVPYTVPDDNGEKSTVTLILDFTHEGKTSVLAETYHGLGPWTLLSFSADCPVICVPEWREPITEIRLTGPAASGSGGNKSGTGGGGGSGGGAGASGGPSGLRITLGRPGLELSSALVAALELPEGSVPYLDVVDTVGSWDHSAAGDGIGTTQRLKVNIRFRVQQ